MVFQVSIEELLASPPGRRSPLSAGCAAHPAKGVRWSCARCCRSDPRDDHRADGASGGGLDDRRSAYRGNPGVPHLRAGNDPALGERPALGARARGRGGLSRRSTPRLLESPVRCRRSATAWSCSLRPRAEGGLSTDARPFSTDTSPGAWLGYGGVDGDLQHRSQGARSPTSSAPAGGREHDAERLQNLCPECGKVLFARYDFERAARTLTREAVAARPRGMWRWRELLPVREARNVVSLGEGRHAADAGATARRTSGAEAAAAEGRGHESDRLLQGAGHLRGGVAGAGARRPGRGSPHRGERRRGAGRLCRAGRARGTRLHGRSMRRS
jgi:hypothetical protein